MKERKCDLTRNEMFYSIETLPLRLMRNPRVSFSVWHEPSAGSGTQPCCWAVSPLLPVCTLCRHTGASASHTPQVSLAHLGQSHSSQCCTSAVIPGFAHERGCLRCPGSPGLVQLHLAILQSLVLWTGSFHIEDVQTG